MRDRTNLSLACLLAAGLLVGTTFAQDAPAEGWSKSVTFGLNATQASFDNWAGGGEDAIAWQAQIDGKATREFADASWEFTGKVGYGETKLGDSGFRKSTDETMLGTAYTWMKKAWVNPYVSATFSSQLADGFVYTDTPAGVVETRTSEMFDPAYFTEAFGVGHEYDYGLKLKIGLAAKQTIGSDTYGWADDPDTQNEVETLRSEFGAEFIAQYERKINDAVTFKSKLTTFWGAGPFDETDTDWDSSLVASLTDAIKVSFNLRVLRDADIDRRRQLKQNLSIGLIYTLI